MGGRVRIHMFDMGEKEIEWEQRGINNPLD